MVEIIISITIGALWLITMYRANRFAVKSVLSLTTITFIISALSFFTPYYRYFVIAYGICVFFLVSLFIRKDIMNRISSKV